MKTAFANLSSVKFCIVHVPVPSQIPPQPVKEPEVAFADKIIFSPCVKVAAHVELQLLMPDGELDTVPVPVLLRGISTVTL